MNLQQPWGRLVFSAFEFGLFRVPSSGEAGGVNVVASAVLITSLAFAPACAFPAPPGGTQLATTEPLPVTLPPSRAGTSVVAGSLLKDDSSLVSWLKSRNQEVLAAAARVEQAGAELGQARLLPNPNLASALTDVPLGETNPPGLGYGDTAIYGVNLSETVEIGKRGPRIAAARLRLEAERQSYLDTLSQKVAEARQALGRVVYLKSRQAVLDESLASVRENLELQHNRADSGDLSGNDYDRLVVDSLLLESEVEANRQEVEAAGALCASILLAACEAGDADLTLLAAAAPVPDSPDVDASLGRRPDLRALAFDRDSARQAETLARRRRIPDPNLSLGYTRDNLVISGDQPRTMQFGLSIPLPIFDRGQHDAAAAEQHALELEATTSASRERGRADVAALLSRKTFLETALGTLLGEAVSKSKGVLDATLSAVNQGGMSMTDLLLARKTHIELLLRVMDLQFELFTVRNDLRRTLGLDAVVAEQNAGH